MGAHNDGISLDTENMYMPDPQPLTSWVLAAARSFKPSPWQDSQGDFMYLSI